MIKLSVSQKNHYGTEVEKVSIKMHQDSSWNEVLLMIPRFLAAAGYIVSLDEIADFFVEESGQNVRYADEDGKFHFQDGVFDLKRDEYGSFLLRPLTSQEIHAKIIEDGREAQAAQRMQEDLIEEEE